MCYNVLKEVVNMNIFYEKFYERSLQEIRNLGGVLSRKHWNDLAMKKNLLSTETLKCISGMEYEALCLKVLQEDVSESDKDKLLT